MSEKIFLVDSGTNISKLEQKIQEFPQNTIYALSYEIHKVLGNRPKMFPGFIGGHCVIPNLDLIQNQTLDLIKSINQKYSKQVKNSKNIHKKYTK